MRMEYCQWTTTTTIIIIIIIIRVVVAIVVTLAARGLVLIPFGAGRDASPSLRIVAVVMDVFGWYPGLQRTFSIGTFVVVIGGGCGVL